MKKFICYSSVKTKNGYLVKGVSADCINTDKFCGRYENVSFSKNIVLPDTLYNVKFSKDKKNNEKWISFVIEEK